MSPQALEALAGASRLRCLNVVDCSVSDDAVAQLRTANPSLAISHTRAPEGYWEIVITDSDVRWPRASGQLCAFAVRGRV